MNTGYREVVDANILVKMPLPGFVFGIIRTVILRLGAVGLSGLGIRFFNWFRINHLDWTEFHVCVSVCERIALRNNVRLGGVDSEQIVEGDCRKQAGEEVKSEPLS